MKFSLAQFTQIDRKVPGFLCSSERDDRLFQVQKCHSGLIKLKRLLETLPRQHTTVTFRFAARYFFISIPSISSPSALEGGAGHLLMNKLQLSLGPLVQGDGSFGNRRKSRLINGDINHGLARLAERRSISCLIYGRGRKRKR